MFVRIWFNILILLACSYGAYGILDNTAYFYTTQHWQYYLYIVSPWILLFGSIKAWYRTFIWRRMLNNRQTPPILSRGEHRTKKNTLRTSILEYCSILFLLLAVAAIMKQLSIGHIFWWIGSFIFAFFMLRFAIKKVS
ncbi:MAG: hypothetical protein KME56_12425 [Candidatus Thiodiazotropha sp. (ex Ctena orbiculata)]|nr:hypothetical protein [Candidatus Thiodiazotropha taylori]MBT2997426.1 hypothetical protein [Candidatus Thiodiazotropha taylori]MBT3001100.1 hypothetical protein [Candidatus Thiodiazotropha taylori]MBV2107496.1 hypothetical protein [Candidatus Thiodiazotropha taylori]MBV2111947.1 hypothetical protein [Candidatus Thiodiazotropha taylori]